MTSWKRRLAPTLASTLLLSAVVAVPVATLGYTAQEFERGPRGRGGRGALRMFRGLDLTEEQREQIRALMTDGYAEETRTRLREARQALNEAVDDPSVDEFSLRQRADTVGQVEGDVAVLRRQRQARIKEILTPEQVQKMEEMQAQMKAKHEERIRRSEECRRERREGGEQPREL